MNMNDQAGPSTAPTYRDTGLKRKRTFQVGHAEHQRYGNHPFIAKSMKGECAPFNNCAQWIHDPFNMKMYMLGGTRPTDEANIPTSDFFRYDTETMKWEDLTHSVTYHNPFDPYSCAALKREKVPLPAVGDPGCTLWRLQNTSFIFVFGGYDCNEDQVSSNTIIINLERLEWWRQPIKGKGSPKARLCPAVVAIESRVYIFGGYGAYEGDPDACYSYSIAEWRPSEGPEVCSKWRWEVQDVPYHGQMPCQAVVGQAISVFGGKKIFLTPGRLNASDERSLDFTTHNLFLFRPADRAFQRVELMGDFPKSIGYYYAFDFRKNQQSTTTASRNLPHNLSSPPPKKRGRPRKHPLPTPLAPAQSSGGSPAPSNLVTSSVLVCAWVPDTTSPLYGTDDPDYTPELYHLNLDPSCEEIKHVNIAGRIGSREDYSFEGFAFVGDRMHLLGTKREQSDADEEDDEDEDGPDPTWDVYLDISFAEVGVTPR
ncbi:hypothetical protein CPC08DRAFT_148943 [Agrocybe pediades]|nr:hypothetical protein CPC08DRAFT_148943 [Agrocybe pediades]